MDVLSRGDGMDALSRGSWMDALGRSGWIDTLRWRGGSMDTLRGGWMR